MLFGRSRNAHHPVATPSNDTGTRSDDNSQCVVTVAYDNISLGYDIHLLLTITLGKAQCMTDYSQRPAQSHQISPTSQQGVTAAGRKTENYLLNVDSLPGNLAKETVQ